MAWFRWICIGLAATVLPVRATAESSGDPFATDTPVATEASVLSGDSRFDSGIQLQYGQLQPAESAVGDVPVCAEPVIETPCLVELDEFLGYRYDASSIDWIFGDDDQFGMFSLVWDHYLKAGEETGVGLGLKIHFLDGPVRTEMPPRLFDFSIAFQSRKRLGDFSYDVAASVMASGDFEGSNREGILFPGHAVGFWHYAPGAELVLGVDYLDRRDVALLPVGGFILMPHPDVRLEMIFPRPRAVFRVTDKHRLFVRGELGGGTWDVFRADIGDDVATYRDLRLCVGLEGVQKDGSRQALEIGYLFDRRLEYNSGVGDYHLDDTAMIRWIQSF